MKEGREGLRERGCILDPFTNMIKTQGPCPHRGGYLQRGGGKSPSLGEYLWDTKCDGGKKDDRHRKNARRKEGDRKNALEEARRLKGDAKKGKSENIWGWVEDCK